MDFLKINRFAGILAIACAFLFYNEKIVFAENFIYGNNNKFEKSSENTEIGNEIYFGTELYSAINLIYSSDKSFVLYLKNDYSGIYKQSLINGLPSGSPILIQSGVITWFDYSLNGKLIYGGDYNSFYKINLESESLNLVSNQGPINISPDGNKIAYRKSNGFSYVSEFSNLNVENQFGSYLILSGGNKTNSQGKFCLINDNSELFCKVGFWEDQTGLTSINTNFWVYQYQGFGFLNEDPETAVFINAKDGYKIYKLNTNNGTFNKILDSSQLGIYTFSPVLIPPPAEIVIDGLTCKTDIIPDIENATWYNNFMNNTGFLSNVDDDGWIRFYSWSGSIYDFPDAQYVNRAGLYFADQTAGGNFSSGSLNYPGTARTTIRGGNKSPLLLSFSDSEIKPNVVQWHGVNSVALGYAGTVQFQNTQLQDSPEVPISASGGIATAVISGNERINKVLLNYSSGFNGFRYGVAPTTSKSSCSYKYNLCEWSIEGANTVCQSGNLVGGIPAGNCVITGSGSVYGSGSCVPETTASGAIIPPIMVPGVTVYDSEGNPVGNIYENESVIPDLSCDYSTTDGWTDKIGKTFECVTSFFSSSAKLSKDGISGITGTSQQLGESIKQDIGANTGTTATGSSNMLLNSLYGVDEGVKEYKYVKLSYALLIFTVTVFLIVMLSIILKSGISNIKN